MNLQKRLSVVLNSYYAGTIVAKKTTLINSIHQNSLPYTDFNIKSVSEEETDIDVNFEHFVCKIKLLWVKMPHDLYKLYKVV
jgi:hypothetical protein